MFYENSISGLSSFLKKGELVKGTEKESTVEVTTIDQFCAEQKINFIDILKIDTQGYELEVLKGAENLISNNGIGLVYLEVLFSKLYEDSPSMGDLYNFLTENGYNLFSIYQIYYQDNIASWTDMLFIHESYRKQLK